eukprot:5154252-Pyramimonas_sp.AAC.2
MVSFHLDELALRDFAQMMIRAIDDSDDSDEGDAIEYPSSTDPRVGQLIRYSNATIVCRNGFSRMDSVT